MSTMNISLPEELKAFVDQQVAARAYGSASEYVRELLRRERDIEHLRGLLIEGLESGPGRVADAAYFDGLRERIRQHADKKATPPTGSPAGTSRRGAKAGARRGRG
jgi:antitoxin ParD1/3/4